MKTFPDVQSIAHLIEINKNRNNISNYILKCKSKLKDWAKFEFEHYEIQNYRNDPFKQHRGLQFKNYYCKKCSLIHLESAKDRRLHLNSRKLIKKGIK